MSFTQKTALLSVSDKTGIVDLARELQKREYTIISSGGTAKLLSEHGIEVKKVSDFTGFPELFEGRVKTLHPKIHGGILARPDNEDDIAEMKNNDIAPISLVVVNLYPFEDTVRQDKSRAEIIENIDIGGPTLIRAAAKNHRHVLVVVKPSQYSQVLDFIDRKKDTTDDVRQRFAVEAFSHTAYYDAVISNYFWSSSFKDEMPSQYALPVTKIMDLRYGENPHQKAALYNDGIGKGFLVSDNKQLSGKQLSYNNLLDADAALKMVRSFSEPAVVIVKHNNPCGAAIGPSIKLAYERALSCDPVSAFGSIVAANREIDKESAVLMKQLFIEVILAPSYTEEALEILQSKKNLRLILVDAWERIGDSRDWRKIGGGFLCQDSDRLQTEKSCCRVVTSVKPDDKDWQGLLFSWEIASHVKSNAIVITSQNQTLGIGAGQMSRLDSVQCAVMKSNFDLKGTYLASDAFFPFRDGVDLAAEQGVKAIIQPGGSVRDQEVIDACNEHGIAMVFTGIRHFKH